MVCIHIIGHFHCDGPFVVAGGRRRHVLASDYAVSCDGAIWHLYAAYAGLMLAAFVVGAPLAALAALRRNRPAGAPRRRRSSRLDGALASLTQRYTPQFWWFEAVAVLVIFVPNAPALRVALCLFGVSAYLWFTAAFRPVARASSHVVESLAYAMLWFLALYATVSETRAGDSVKGACSAALFVFVVAVCGLTRHIKSNEGDFKLGDAILRREPFAAAKFEAATPRTSAHAARRGAGPGPGSPEAAALGFGDVLELVAETTWSRFEVLRLDALWAMNGTSEVMARRCASFLAAEPWGSDLRGLANRADPILAEIQIWATPIMALNDVSHAQYEVVRAGAPGDI
ncbi:hypothetical protein JL720_8494 [Aureococcus anophagefferens]|nr:hypothetical protein JL720_8494 [Aureococcus anophagefferens]